MPNKLKLKRTPEEEEGRRLRKEKKREKEKRKRKRGVSISHNHGSSSKKLHADQHEDSAEPKWASSDEDEEQYGPQPAGPSLRPHAQELDYETIRREVEERLFREKLFDAMGDDEMLDNVEATFNSFAHVPNRWRTTVSEYDTGRTKAHYHDDPGLLNLDPRYMDDEEYAEWIRAGMYRKTHAAEYAEQQRQKAAHKARLAEENARKAETARLERVAEEERKKRKKERQHQRLDYAREQYHLRWTALLSSLGENENDRMLEFHDIPWPVAIAYREAKADRRRHHSTTQDLTDSMETSPIIGLDDLTEDAISSFLLPVVGIVGEGDEPARKKERKEKLRETFLRFHPDKFEGRFIKRFREPEREKVREAIGQISRILNSLMV